MSQSQSYLRKRRQELHLSLNEDCVPAFNAGFDFMEIALVVKFPEVTPEFIRKAELLECLLFSFIEHCFDIELLNNFEKALAAQGAYASGRTLQ
jgi:hypothetical protein